MLGWHGDLRIDPFLSHIDASEDVQVAEAGIEFVPEMMGVRQPGVCIKGEGGAGLLFGFDLFAEFIPVDPVVQ